VLRENSLATLHFLLNVCIGLHPSTILTVLSVYLTGLTVSNVYCIDVFQYSFVPFFYGVGCSENVLNCSPPTSLVQWLMLVC
jgi:hypothetical protein